MCTGHAKQQEEDEMRATNGTDYLRENIEHDAYNISLIQSVKIVTDKKPYFVNFVRPQSYLWGLIKIGPQIRTIRKTIKDHQKINQYLHDHALVVRDGVLYHKPFIQFKFADGVERRIIFRSHRALYDAQKMRNEIISSLKNKGWKYVQIYEDGVSLT